MTHIASDHQARAQRKVLCRLSGYNRIIEETDAVPRMTLGPQSKLTVLCGAQLPANRRDGGCRKPKDWNKLEAEVKQEEKDEKLDGDAGLQKFFQSIYAGADEDTRRAMNKSFQESNGTVLSTDWKDIGSKKTVYKPSS